MELTPLVRDVCQQGRFWRTRRSQVSAEVPDEPVSVEANDPALRRMLLLLLDNAVKYTPAGGRITLSVGRDAAGASVAVRDTGIGIPETALPHVFERFYRWMNRGIAMRAAPGSGYPSRNGCRTAHASLEAESVVGEGWYSGSGFRLLSVLNQWLRSH